jgi:hypothetical protein
MPPGLLLITDMDSPPTDPHHYSQIVGKLIFLTTTRPDIAYAVSSVSRYLSSPQQAHLNAVYHILRYLKKTADYGLLYSKQNRPLAQGYTDADWASCPETRRSTGGYLFTLLGAAITWQSKRQLTVSRSSTESEYILLSSGTQEAVWVGRLLGELADSRALQLPLQHTSVEAASDLEPYLCPLTLSCDNQSSLKLAKNPLFHARTKHIEVGHHFVREKALEGKIKLDYIPTNL